MEIRQVTLKTEARVTFTDKNKKKTLKRLYGCNQTVMGGGMRMGVKNESSTVSAPLDHGQLRAAKRREGERARL